MAPPTTKLRLSQIDPFALGRAVEDDVVHHMQRLGVPMSLGVDITIRDARRDGDGPSTSVGMSVADLARYAVAGVALDADVHEYMVSLLDVLAPPVGGATGATGLDAALAGDRDVDELGTDTVDQIAMVACAALARESIDAGHPVRAGWLAALGGVSTTQVRTLARLGELDRDEDGAVTAESARRWLVAREVPGIKPAPAKRRGRG